MAERYFTYGPHMMTKALRKANFTFPATKAECMEMAGDIMLQVDFDTFRPLREVIAEFDPDYFPNNQSFFCAWLSTGTKALMKEIGY